MHKDCMAFELQYKALAERYQTLQGTCKQLKSSLEQQMDMSEKYRDQLKDVKDSFEKILQHVAGEVYEKIPKDERQNWSIEQTGDFVIEYSARRLLIYHQIIKDLNKTFKDEMDKKNTIIKELEERLSGQEKYAESLANDLNRRKNGTPTPQDNPAPNPETSRQPEINPFVNSVNDGNGAKSSELPNYFNTVAPAPQKPAKPPKDKPINDQADTEMTSYENLNDQEKLALRNLGSELDDEKKAIIFTLGSTGEYTAKKIHTALTTSGISMEMTKFYGNLNELVSGTAMKKETIRLSTGRGAPASAFCLTRVGYAFYEKEFGKRPVVSLLQELKEEHKSEDHGHAIREIEEALKERGFITSIEDEVETPSGAKTVCDVKAFRGAFVFRIEYEEGNYSEQDYFDKFSRIFEVTKDLRIIVRNMEVKKKLLKVVDRYVVTNWQGVGAKERFKKEGYTVSVITIEEFRKKTDWPLNIL